MNHAIRQTVNGFKRILIVTPPFDKRNVDPSKDYGIHGAEYRMILVKGTCAVHFLAYLGVYLPHVAKWLNEKHATSTYNPFAGMGEDVGYHSPKPTYKGQKVSRDKCLYTGYKCYCDGSGLRAEEWYKIWLAEGNDRIWKMLEEEWQSRFGKKKRAKR